ncbi:sensor histidine kinase [Chitinophagaceae bacterium MMS25-I14]
MQLNTDAIKRVWYRMVGTAADFTLDNIAFNAISVVTFVLLIILLPLNAFLQLYNIVGLLIILLGLQSLLYYYARFRKKYITGLVCYAAASYLGLIYTFLFNAGSMGPAIFIFFLTFQLLIAFTRKELHPYWFFFHLVVPTSLLIVEFFRPAWIPPVYHSRTERYGDLLSSYTVILVGMYWVTIYLRKNYNKEKKVAENRLVQIEEQNRAIRTQNEELEELNRQKVKLFSAISHDLRSPLATSVGLAELLGDESLSEEERVLFQQELLNLSRISLDMFTNLLAWSSSQMEGVKKQVVRLRLKELAEKVITSKQVIIDKKTITVHNLLEDESYVWADADMMELIMRNILQNAVKFTEPSGAVYFEGRMHEGFYELAIRDTGVGMTPAQIDVLFSLKTISTHGTDNERGSGLGLVLCREFAELMGGNIRVTSVLDVGSTFYISIPKA